jgi:dolichol-phosphate mannosyltransferase
VSEAPVLSLIVCTLNEAESIGAVLREASAVLAGRPYEIIVVDDSADDATAQVVLAHAEVNPAVRLIRREGARGLASAAIKGWDAARGEVLGIIDGDGQHDVTLLPAMLEKLGAEAEVVMASRYLGGGESGLKGYRNLISRVATGVCNLLLGARASDPLAGYFLMRRDWYALVRPRLTGIGFKILVDVLASGPRAPRTAEVSTALRPRIGGESKLDLSVMMDLAALLIEKRTRGAIRARFLMFSAVGLSGVFIHAAVLILAYRHGRGVSFPVAQALGIWVAMNSNFLLNNALTFRDRRLKGLAMLRGLLAFYVCCAAGGLVAEAVGMGLKAQGVQWLAAGVAGALAAGVWNYLASKWGTWGSLGLGDAARTAYRPRAQLK